MSARSAVRRLVYRRFDEVLIVHDLHELMKVRGPGILHLEEATPDHLPALFQLVREQQSAAMERKLQEYVRCGYRTHLAVENGKIVGYIWWMDSSVGSRRIHPALARLGFELTENDVCSWDLYLAPSHRGRGQAWMFFGEHMETLRRLGYRRAVGWVEVQNGPARMLYRMFNSRDLGTSRFGLLFSRLLISGSRVYVRNGRRSLTPFDFRLVFPKRSWGAVGLRSGKIPQN